MVSAPGGSSGWQAPEQLISRSGGEVRQSKSVDIFSFGLVLFYCLSGGKHAFGESYERDFNILQVPAQALCELPFFRSVVWAALLRPSSQRQGHGAGS